MEPSDPADRSLTGTDQRPTIPADRPPDDRPRLVTMAEAAEMTGQTVEAIRSRVRRKTLRATKGNHGFWMVHIEDLHTGRPPMTVADRPAADHGRPAPTGAADHSADRRPTADDRVPDHLEELLAETRRRADAAEARVATVEAEAREARRLADQRAEEVAGLRERIGRVEADRRAAESAADRAERRLSAAEAALHQAQLPWHERLARLVQAFRGRG